MTVAVVQMGARMHYAVPRILHGAGLLERLFTDFCSRGLWSQTLRAIPSFLRPCAVRKLLERQPDGIPSHKIVTYSTTFGLRYAAGLRRQLTAAQLADTYLDAGMRLGTHATRCGFGSARAVYAFNTAALAVFREARRRGIATVYEQSSAPVMVEWRLAKEESNVWKGWERWSQLDDFYARLADVQSLELDLADTILCGSEFVREAIRSTNGPVEKAWIVQYGVGPVSCPNSRPPIRGRPLRVLIAGTVSLLKGAPYVAEAAHALKSQTDFRWVGDIALSGAGVTELVKHVKLIGSVARSDMATHYKWADVLLLPSICEGSATVTYEAIQHGLPLIVTPNTGAPLPTGAPGIVPIRNSQAITFALGSLIDNPDEYSRAAVLSQSLAEELTIGAYGKRLLAVLPNCPEKQSN